MASRKTKGKGKATKKPARKKVRATGGAKRKAAKSAKKPRKPKTRLAAAKAVVEKTLESTGAMNLLRAWSPTRYSTR
jgi:hypothetical protein